MSAVLAGSMALPLELVDLDEHAAALTVEFTPMGEEPQRVLAYRRDSKYLYVPRQYGLQFCEANGIDWIDRTEQGHEALFPCVPSPRDYQIEGLAQVEAACHDSYDFLFRARTGWGKTIGSLIIAARLGRSTIVVVDQEKLKLQWITALTKHFGLLEEEVGVIQGDTFRHEGCPVTIAMVQTLVAREFSPSFYRQFGFLVVDEVHSIGSPTFSTILSKFPAMYRMGVSATPKRRDTLQKLLTAHLGEVKVYIGDEHKESSVYVIEHPTVYSWYANISPKTGRFITEISEDGARNLMLVEAIQMLYDSGRDSLILSDRIEHLRALMDLCYYIGIPLSDMGLYVGSTPYLRYAKEATPKRRPKGADDESPYTPIALQSISKKTKRSALDAMESSCRLLFGTYNMFSKGVDIARLLGGVDATPRSQAEQVHGRILRQADGPVKPIWVTTADTNSYRAMHGLAGRIPGYQINNAKIYLWNFQEQAIAWDAKEYLREIRRQVSSLKSMQLGQNSDGLNTLSEAKLSNDKERTRVREAVKAIQAGKGSAAPVLYSSRVRAVKSPVSPSMNPSPSRRTRFPKPQPR